MFFLISCALEECPVPFAVIFGGTDLNEHHKDQEKLKTMSEVTEKARYLLGKHFSCFVMKYSGFAKTIVFVWHFYQSDCPFIRDLVMVKSCTSNCAHKIQLTLSDLLANREVKKSVPVRFFTHEATIEIN